MVRGAVRRHTLSGSTAWERAVLINVQSLQACHNPSSCQRNRRVFASRIPTWERAVMNSSMLKRMVPRSRRRRRYAVVSANATKPVMSTLDSTHTSTCGEVDRAWRQVGGCGR